MTFVNFITNFRWFHLYCGPKWKSHAQSVAKMGNALHISKEFLGFCGELQVGYERLPMAGWSFVFASSGFHTALRGTTHRIPLGVGRDRGHRLTDTLSF